MKTLERRRKFNYSQIVEKNCKTFLQYKGKKGEYDKKT